MNIPTVYPEGHTMNESEISVNGDRENFPDNESRDRYVRENSAGFRAFLGVDEVSRIDFLVPLLAEAFGTFFLVLIGCASCITWETEPTPTHIALTFGLVVASLAQILGPISGCHINPAVTTGLIISGKCSVLRSLCYILCQCGGAIAGSIVLKLAISGKTISPVGVTELGGTINPGQGILIETIITTLLVLVVLAVTDTRRTDNRGWAPLAIGLAVTVAHLAMISATGSSMNPARSFGPALIYWKWSHQYVYWFGPLLGGVLAGILHKMVFRVKSKEDEAAQDF